MTNIYIIDFLYITMVAISQLTKFFRHVSLQDAHDERIGGGGLLIKGHKVKVIFSTLWAQYRLKVLHHHF